MTCHSRLTMKIINKFSCLLVFWFSMLLVGCAGESAQTSPSEPRTTRASGAVPSPVSPLVFVNEIALSPRLREITVMSPALNKETKLRLLLPKNYEPSATVRYPVLYLLHGCCNNKAGYSNWTTTTDVEAFTENLPVLIVMPDGGDGGFYSDWYNNGLPGGPRWETYHISELMTWIEQRYPVRRERQGRMLMGLSMGGHGSFAYAAKYPDLFASAAAFSPALDTNTLTAQTVIDASSNLDGGPQGSIWGLRLLEEVRWRGHNPWDLAENLGSTKLFIRTGDGRRPGVPVATDPLEIGVHEMANNMHNELDRLKIPHSFVDYGEGTHTAEYWQEGLHITLPQQLEIANRESTEPQQFSYRSIDATFTVFGWEVSIDRQVLEFARLGDASPSGFVLSGSGLATVKTAAWFKPNASYTVVLDGLSKIVQADSDGRLTLTVDLGPARTVQEYRSGSESGYLRNVTVRIK